LEFEKARVRWFLSINADTLPKELLEQDKTTYRSMKIGGEEIEFSDGFSDLHTKSYKAIIDGKGFGIEAIKSATDIVYQIRNTEPVGLKGEYHPFAKLPMSKHPFGK
jgi:UDP-N-acetyl-2-amino-2-deoxyglucuronate dehydrogenase